MGSTGGWAARNPRNFPFLTLTPSHHTAMQGCSKPCACQLGQYEAVYGQDGALEVRQGDGKRVWRKRKWLQPKVLRPWPLAK